MACTALTSSNTDDVELPLTYFSIGLWNKKTRGALSISALLLHSSQQFVFLVDATSIPQVAQQGVKRVLQRLTAGSPFKSRKGSLRSVLAFEVKWKNIIGLDYSNPLCLPGRLVLEARNTTKREFSSMKDVYECYVPKLQSITQRQTTTARLANLEEAMAAKHYLCSPDQSWRPHSASALSSLDLAATSVHTGVAFVHATGKLAIRRSENSAKPQRSARFDIVTEENGEGRSSESDCNSELNEALAEPRSESLSTHRASFRSDRQYRPPHLSPISNYQAATGRGDWPPPSTWTVASAVFEYRSITCNFDNLGVPGALKPVIQADERLLKLYESGLPAWAIYAPQYGLWYRPWLRRLTYMLFVIISCFSLVMGFYDLYKNVPYLDKFLRQVCSMYMPSTAILQWLDEHMSIRLSILFAYLFGKSELAVQLLRWMGNAGAFAQASLQPVLSIAGPTLAFWGSTLQQWWLQLASAASSFAQLTHFAAAAIFGPPFAALVDAFRFLSQLVLPILQAVANVCAASVVGPWTLLKIVATTVSATIVTAVQTAAVLARAIKTGTRIAPAVTSSAKGVGSQVTFWYVAFPMEALEVVKNSAVKVIRALQTLMRLCSQVASDIARHRLTLQLRMQRTWRKTERSVQQALPPQLLYFWIWMRQKRAIAPGQEEKLGDGNERRNHEELVLSGTNGFSHEATVAIYETRETNEVPSTSAVGTDREEVNGIQHSPRAVTRLTKRRSTIPTE